MLAKMLTSVNDTLGIFIPCLTYFLKTPNSFHKINESSTGFSMTETSSRCKKSTVQNCMHKECRREHALKRHFLKKQRVKSLCSLQRTNS